LKVGKAGNFLILSCHTILKENCKTAIRKQVKQLFESAIINIFIEELKISFIQFPRYTGIVLFDLQGCQGKFKFHGKH
jgi:hypothetical protein